MEPANRGRQSAIVHTCGGSGQAFSQREAERAASGLYSLVQVFPEHFHVILLRQVR